MSIRVGKTITKKVRLEKAEEFKSDMMHFGYVVTNEIPNGNKVEIEMVNQGLPNFKKVKKLEKLYRKANYAFTPVALIIFLILTIVPIVLLVSFKDAEIFKTAFYLPLILYIVGGFSLAFSLYLIFVYIILKVRHKKFNVLILKKCDELNGFSVGGLPNNSLKQDPLASEISELESHQIK